MKVAAKIGGVVSTLALVAALGACSSDGDSSSGGSAVDTSESVAGTLPGDGDAEPSLTPAPDPAETIDVASIDCDAEGIDLEAGWPYEVADAVTVLATTNDTLRYRLVGITTDADSTLADTIDVSFADLESGEPEGSDDEVTVELTGDAGIAELRLDRTSTDECWLVEIDTTYVQAPPAPSSGSTGEVDDPLDELASVGSGNIITGRGAYPLAVIAS